MRVDQVGSVALKVDRLTRREHQVARAYADGESYRDIAERLFIAPATVRTHLKAIYRKLGVSTKIQLLRKLEGTAASEHDARRASPDAERVAADPRDCWWAVAAAGHPLPARVSGLRKEARLALQSSLVEAEQIEPWLRASEVHFRAVMEALPGVVLLKDRALRYMYANRCFLDEWQLRPDHVLGRTQQEVFSGGLGFAWSRATDDRDARVLRTARATGFYFVRVPVGTRDAVLWARKLPLRNREGRVSHLLTIGIDITSLDRAPPEMGAGLPSADLPLAAATVAKSSHSRIRARILMVDGDPGARQLAVEALERNGHTVETAASGREALAILAMRPVDLIVADIRMADLDGPGLHQLLTARRPELLERLVFTTRADLPADLEGFVCETGVEILEKPFVARDIVARTEARLAVSGAHLKS
jgi:DNA-binding NarL/FixJ family response regulator